MNYAKWIEHFTRNKQNRPEPDWAAPNNVPSDVLAPVLRSVEQFRLGDGGGPASLIAFDRENFRSRTDEMRQIVDLWFAEEAEHARLLGCAVQRFGGRFIQSHWSFTAFCLCRRVLGVKFELQVLTLTELVSTAYYRMIRSHSPDGPLAAMCELILRDRRATSLPSILKMKTVARKSDWSRWWLVVIYAAAMAWVESAVVFYLRSMIDRIEPYQPDPLPVIGGFAAVELPQNSHARHAVRGRRAGGTDVAGAIWLCPGCLRRLGYFLLRVSESDLRLADVTLRLGRALPAAAAVVGAGALAGSDFVNDDFVGHVRQPV